MQKMQPLKPYLVRAYYDWICESNLTPYLLVQANLPHVVVPQKSVDPDDGTIVLNISALATNKLLMNNQRIQFQARFDNTIWDISIPYEAIGGIYAEENEEGIYFQIDPEAIQNTENKPPIQSTDPTKKSTAHPHLRIVKTNDH